MDREVGALIDRQGEPLLALHSPNTDSLGVD
jgi:hypothetical protein